MTDPEHGRLCADDDDFKARARRHQSLFRIAAGLREYAEYGSRLTTADAVAGHNFHLGWDGLFEAVQARYPLKDRARPPKLYWDMLGSDSIPFNLFVPLRDERTLASALASHWVGVDVSVTSVELEWAPRPKAEYLNDATSFDAFLTYETSGAERGCIGVETKFTEGEYGYGDRERERLFDETSEYNRTHDRCGLYVEGARSELRTKRFKQVWRNHLLGEAMLHHPRAEFRRFTSVLLYPRGNTHFAAVTEEYPRWLRPQEGWARFVGSTYEDVLLFLRSREHSPKVAAWLDYLERRYVVAPA